VPLDIAAGFHQWQSVTISPNGSLDVPLRWLAGAQWTPTRNLEALAPLLAAQPAESRVFVLSDTPVKYWEDLLPQTSCDVLCLSVSDMRLRRPLFFRTSLTPQAG
jgi:hypothetical protein